ncbi:MAG: YbgA family protein [Planctomycetota bacterium]
MRLRIGVSQCLLGDNVRYDGGHKHDAFLTHTLGPFVEYVTVCPELEVGMGVPREAIHIERAGRSLALVGVKSGTDHTAAMKRFAKAKVAALKVLDLDGYVLKSKSPSCGMERVPVHGQDGSAEKVGTGFFARALLDGYEHLPVEEEGRLRDARLRENFIERVFGFRRVKELFQRDWRVGDLVKFHTREKLLLLAHEPKAYTALGRLVAGARKSEALAAEYMELFMKALAKPATPARHVNVLQHMAGYFKKQLDADQKAELKQVIEDFGAGLVPLVVPVTLLKHHVRRFKVSYLAEQIYLEPHPKELMLRNHV